MIVFLSRKRNIHHEDANNTKVREENLFPNFVIFVSSW